MTIAVHLVIAWVGLALTGPGADATSDATTQDIRSVAAEVARMTRRGDHDDAIALIRRAREADDAPVLIFMQATVEADRARCDAAIPLYLDFLDRPVPDIDQQAARDGLLQCGWQERPPAPVVEPSSTWPEDAASTAPVPETGAPAEDADEPRKPNILGYALLGTGGALSLTGTALWIQASIDARAARSSTSIAAFRERGGRAERLEIAGATLTAVGLGLVIGATIHLVWRARATRSSRAVQVFGAHSRPCALF